MPSIRQKVHHAVKKHIIRLRYQKVCHDVKNNFETQKVLSKFLDNMTYCLTS